MKKKDYKKKSDADLMKFLRDTRKLAMDFRFDVAGSKTRNTKEGKNAKKDIARALTEVRARELSTVHKKIS